MRRCCLLLCVGVLAAVAGASAQQREEPPKVTETYVCLAVDCRQLAGALGGGITVEEPLAAQQRALAAYGRNPRSFLAAGFAPYYGDLFGQSAGVGMGDGQGFAAWAPEGLDPPLALVEQNSLLLSGTREAVDRALEILRLIDKPAPMVRVDLKAISTPETFDNGNTLNWRALGGSGQLTGSAGAGGGGLSLGWALGDIGLAFDTFRARSNSYGEENLFIVTESGLPAYIAVRSVEPSFVPERVYDRGGNLITVYHVVYSAIETSLYVVPRVNGNGTVTMLLAPYFSGKIGEVTPPGGTPFPIIQSRGFNTIVTVRDGETVAVGGFKRIVLNDLYQGQGPIGVSDLPRWRRSAQVENVTLFVTPTVIETDPTNDPFAGIEM